MDVDVIKYFTGQRSITKKGALDLWTEGGEETVITKVYEGD
jgi:hypothetical protein